MGEGESCFSVWRKFVSRVDHVKNFEEEDENEHEEDGRVFGSADLDGGYELSAGGSSRAP
jgi:hypothetical protein